MANEDHLAIFKNGVKAWNAWKNENPKVLPNLNGIDFNGADLREVDLSWTSLAESKLRQANLAGANLSGAVLLGADLTEANLTAANLDFAYLNHAILVRTDLSYAVLNTTVLSGAFLFGTNVTGCLMFGVTFGATDLSELIGLETVRYSGPSSIGLESIYESKGRISETLLRGCGVPESFITQMRDLVGAEEGFQFYSCFISYSSKDEEFVRLLHGRLHDAHLRVWFAPEDIKGGKKLHEQIETAIRIHEKMLIVLSEASLQSEWVMDELRKGFKSERDSGKRKLFPVRLTDYKTLQRWVCRDSISSKDLAEEVRQYYIPDFSNWKEHDQFEVAFASLLKDLRAEESAK